MTVNKAKVRRQILLKKRQQTQPEANDANGENDELKQECDDAQSKDTPKKDSNEDDESFDVPIKATPDKDDEKTSPKPSPQ